MTLRARLLLAALYVLAVVVTGLTVPLGATIDRAETRRFESGVLANAALLAARIADDVARAGADRDRLRDPPGAVTRIVAATARETGVRFVVTDALGRVLADSDADEEVGAAFATPERPEFAEVASAPGGTIVVTTRYSETLRQELLLVAVPVVHERAVIGVVRGSEPLGALKARVRRAWAGLAAIGGAAVAGGLVAAWFLATSLARPVRRLEEAAGRLGTGDLEARATPEGPHEVSSLARSFNRMADVLASNERAQREFLANASHQLRTPITGLRLRLEAIEQAGGEPGAQAAKARADVDRLSGLVDDLLALARAASVETTGTEVDLAESAREAVDRWRAPVAERGQRISLVSAERAPAWTDPSDVADVLDSLLENAVRYAPEGTSISVRAWSRDGRSFLSVSDDGPGIPGAERERVFERFYRGSTGRRAGGGTGLGLAIALQLVRRWGGDLSLEDGPGATLVARLPRRPAVS